MASAIPEVLDSVSSFLKEDHQLLIGDRWVPSASGETFAVENPAKEQTIATVARSGAVGHSTACNVQACLLPEWEGAHSLMEARGMSDA